MISVKDGCDRIGRAVADLVAGKEVEVKGFTEHEPVMLSVREGAVYCQRQVIKGRWSGAEGAPDREIGGALLTLSGLIDASEINAELYPCPTSERTGGDKERRDGRA